MPSSVEGAQKYGVAPEKHNDVYEAISPTLLAGSMKGKVVLVTGAGMVTAIYRPDRNKKLTEASFQAGESVEQ